MVFYFGDISSLTDLNSHSHEPTAFLASNLMGKIAIDPTKSSTSTSDANYVTSSDIYDERYLCDAPISAKSACGCSGEVASRGLVGEAGRTFPGSSLTANGTTTAGVGPLGIAAPANGIPHPSFRFAQRVTDVAFNMTDVTIPGQEKVVWDAKFRLVGPDGSLGSDYLPSSLPPIGGEVQNFHKLCSALNSMNKYTLKISAGGNAPIDQKIALSSRIVQPPALIDPQIAASRDPESAIADMSEAKFQKVGPRIYPVGGPDAPPASNDTRPAVSTSSFSEREILNSLDSRDGTVFTKSENRMFPSVTSTSFACTRPPPDLRNVPGCHQPPTVTIHTPKTLQVQQQYQQYMAAGQPGYSAATQPVGPAGYPPTQPLLGPRPVGPAAFMPATQPPPPVMSRGFF